MTSERILDTKSEADLLKPDGPKSTLGSAFEALRVSAAHTLVQRPLDAVAQASDQLLGTKALPKVQLIDQPKVEEFGTVNWAAQQVGTAIGALPYLLAIHSTTRGALAQKTLSPDTQQLVLAGSRLGASASKEVAQLELSAAAITGFTYSGLLSPVDFSQTTSTESFMKAKLTNGAIGAGTFAIMTGSMHGIKQLGGQAPEGLAKKILASDLGAATLAGLPAGAFGAQAESLAHGNGIAPIRDTASNMIASSLLSAGFLSLRHPLKTVLEPRKTDLASSFTSIDRVGMKDAGVLLAPRREPQVKPSERIFSREEQQEISQWKAQQDQLKPSNLRETNPQFLEKIADEVYGNGAARKERELHCLLGNCGAGKSSITRRLVKELGAMDPDTDVIKAKLPGYEAGMGNQAVHADSRAVYSMVQNRAFANGDNLIIQVTGIVKPDVAKLLSNAREHGYSVVMHMVDVAPEISARRVFTRAHEVNPETGIRQMIPPAVPLKSEYQYNARRTFFQVIGESAKDLHQGRTPLIDGFRFWHSAPRESSILPTTALASNQSKEERLDSLATLANLTKMRNSNWHSEPFNTTLRNR